jgi:hypothetical protein
VFDSWNQTDKKNLYEEMFDILSHKGNAIKMTLRFHLTPVRMAITKKQTTTNAGEGVGKRKPLHTIDGNVN